MYDRGLLLVGVDRVADAEQILIEADENVEPESGRSKSGLAAIRFKINTATDRDWVKKRLVAAIETAKGEERDPPGGSQSP